MQLQGLIRKKMLEIDSKTNERALIQRRIEQN